MIWKVPVVVHALQEGVTGYLLVRERYCVLLLLQTGCRYCPAPLTPLARPLAGVGTGRAWNTRRAVGLGLLCRTPSARARRSARPSRPMRVCMRRLSQACPAGGGDG